MHLQAAAGSPIPVRRPLTDQRPPDLEGGARRDQAMPSSREAAGFLDRNAVMRIIEHLERSGCRPLHSRPEAPASSATPGAPLPQGAPRETAMDNDVMRSVTDAVKEDGS